MSPETFALLQNLLTREVTDVTYEEVKAALRQHYEENRNFLAARLDFFRTVQQEGQSITDFLAELRNKAKECDFEEQCCVNARTMHCEIDLKWDVGIHLYSRQY